MTRYRTVFREEGASGIAISPDQGECIARMAVATLGDRDAILVEGQSLRPQAHGRRAELQRLPPPGRPSTAPGTERTSPDASRETAWIGSSRQNVSLSSTAIGAPGGFVHA